MSPRPEPTKWMWYILLLSSGPAWRPVRSVTVHTPEEGPSIIEAQAKFFQYMHSPAPGDFDMGYRLGNDRHFIERHERSRPAAELFSAKVRWGDTKGGYGEHYWDLNHAGNAGNQENQEHDDNYDNDPYQEELQDYPETIEKSNKYDGEEFNPKASLYKKSARPKRENSKLDVESWKGERNFERPRSTERTKIKRYLSSHADFETENTALEIKHRHSRELHDEKNHQSSQTNNIKLISDHEEAVKSGVKGIVPYESGALRLYKRQVPAVPRLFLESKTGHVIDSATGQAYVLQPVNL